MIYALDVFGNRVYADEAIKGEKYTCPICKNQVVLKRGLINVAHFAHEAYECDDDWNYDMSEWHKRMQNYFPKESQEVVVTHRGKKHRADVLIGDVVLEFQYSPITASEFEDRNRFFKRAGYRLAWVFCLKHIPEDSLYSSEEKENMMIWKHPMRIFANADYLGESNKRFALWFSYRNDYEPDEVEEEYINRVVWAIKDEDGFYSMRRFFISDYGLTLNNKSVINPNLFFNYKGECFKQKLLELKKSYSFSIKYKGKKGEPARAYICPINYGKFGIDLWGERGCYHCRYCYMVARKENQDGKKMYASYCCYPNQVRELFNGSPEDECPEVDAFDL